MAALVGCPQPLAPLLSRLVGAAGSLVEAMTRRYYRIRELEQVEQRLVEGVPFVLTAYEHDGVRRHVAATLGEPEDLPGALHALADPRPHAARRARSCSPTSTRSPRSSRTRSSCWPRPSCRTSVARVAFVLASGESVDVMSFRRADGDAHMTEDRDLRGMHPMMAERMDMWRLAEFELERLPSAHDTYLFRAVARENERDERLVAVAEVRDLTPVRDENGRIIGLPDLERMVRQAFEAMRSFQARRPPRQRLLWNRLLLYAWPPMEFDPAEARDIIGRFARMTTGLGLELVLLRAQMPDGDRVLRIFNTAGQGVVAELDDPPTQPLQPLDEGAQRIVSARRRGTLHPAEIVKILAPHRAAPGAAIPPGEFIEHDLDEESGELVPVERPPATNQASVVVGLIRNRTERYPEGMLRVALLSDPTRALGSLAEPECRRVIAALDLAERLRVPVEWFALSSGAKIAMDSGTENMDWVAEALRRIVQFTQAGGEINVIVTGINVGAQPYWNAEATMLMHTKGILVMSPESAMVLTGKQALDYSGGVSAEDNFGIGGYERVMGPNGQAQYWAPDLAGACEILLAYYERAYTAPGERFPRQAATDDPRERDVRSSPHSAPDSDLETVGEIFSEETNPGRKKPFDVRSVMRAVADADHEPLERWANMREAEIAVAWDARLGGWPVAMLGIESRPLARFGSVPADGPEQWAGGTLFPQGSRKIARVINAASGRRPLVVLANLAGFDGSPESMRRLQLEYGAEIGRAIVNFDGPIVFTVISRFHGGAFVVFSRRLNENLETLALEGSHASVIGGAPAAAVVFAREVDLRTGRDQRIAELDEKIEAAEGAERQQLRNERDALWTDVRSEKLGELAGEFDKIHSVQRAVEVGSVNHVIPAAELRPRLIEAIERGMDRTLDGIACAATARARRRRRSPDRRRASARVQRLDLLRVLLRDRLALELHRRRQLVAAGRPLGVEHGVALDLLDRRELRVGGLDRLGDRGLRAVAGRGRGVGIEHDQRDVVGAAVADHDGRADQRARRLDPALDVGGRHVLARRVDDQLLLAVDDRQVPVLVEGADVARLQPAVGRERVARQPRLVAVAGEHARAAELDLVVLRQPDLDAGHGRPDGADLDPLGRVAGADRVGLAHAPQLAEREPDRVEELDHLARARRRADVERLQRVHAELVSQRGEHGLVGCR